MRRALTLIEMLLALTLLTAIMAAAATWTQLSGRISSSTIEPIRLRTAAQSVLQMIQDDLSCGDLNQPAQQQQDPSPRVIVAEKELQIKTRTPGRGPVMREYRFDEHANELFLSESMGRRLLLIKVEEFECKLDQDRGELSVSIVVSDGIDITMRFLVP